MSLPDLSGALPDACGLGKLSAVRGLLALHLVGLGDLLGTW